MLHNCFSLFALPLLSFPSSNLALVFPINLWTFVVDLYDSLVSLSLSRKQNWIAVTGFHVEEGIRGAYWACCCHHDRSPCECRMQWPYQCCTKAIASPANGTASIILSHRQPIHPHILQTLWWCYCMKYSYSNPLQSDEPSVASLGAHGFSAQLV